MQIYNNLSAIFPENEDEAIIYNQISKKLNLEYKFTPLSWVFLKLKDKYILNIKKEAKTETKTKNYYIVKPLDTISSISKKLNIDEEFLKSILKNQKLYIGKKIEF